MITKLVVTPLALALSFSAPLLAKGNPHDNNSNKQSIPGSTRSQERATERHELKKEKRVKKDKKQFKDKKKKFRDDIQDRRGNSDGRQDRYRRQYEEERNGLDRRYERNSYPQNPTDMIIDRNVNDAKTGINEVHRRVIDSIDNKTRDLTGVDTRR